ncbi:MAG: M20/M25/M40 family metallo-hydrolase [Armatimonadota bacterium]|nr:M20/M25/M40 family metallo-hydrolase [Armatimonadota bacterium]MDR5697363.1 M20/M25/M40 family metallo-hydrolase [Armatimonadota bacterium]
MKDVFDHIERNADDYLAQLQRLVRQPSVAAQGIGIEECAHLVARMLEEAGARTQVLRLEGAAPLVYGEIPGHASKTLLIYEHYDVQPPEPLEEWQSDPFDPQIRNGKLYGRGVADTKGNLVARLSAIRALHDVRGRIPVTVKFLVEGEEEIGSVNLPRYAHHHASLFRADGCLWESGGKDHQETPNLYLGVKGICYVELRARAANRDLHSSLATIVPNPAWRLVWALGTLKDRQENILIEGFYDDVAEPTPDELQELRRIAAQRDDQALLRDLELDRYLLGLSGLELLKRHLYQPTCTICGLVSGYTGAGSKTVLPKVARAKLDFRLVPNQRADDVLAKLRAHLSRHGFGDIEVDELGLENPAKTPMDSEIARVVANAAREVYGREPIVYPLMAATGPMDVVCAQFGTPAVGAGIGYPGTNVHAPNENIRIRDYVDGIKHVALILELYGR